MIWQKTSKIVLIPSFPGFSEKGVTQMCMFRKLMVAQDKNSKELPAGELLSTKLRNLQQSDDRGLSGDGIKAN